MNAIKGTARLALIGAVSGALYALWNFGVLQSQEGTSTTISKIVERIFNEGGAGLFYGVIVGAVLRKALGFSRFGWPLYVVAAALAYFVALNLAIGLYQNQQSDLATALSGAAAGAVGALLLDIATVALSPLARHRNFFGLTMAAGAIAGLLLPVALNVDSLWTWIAFFAVWQCAYAAATAYATRPA